MLDALSGDLRFVRLSSLLQLVEAEGITGALTLVGNGSLRLSRGDIAAVSAGPLEGYAALRTLFFVPDGRFELAVDPDPDAPRSPPLVPVTRAVLDGVRLLDEWARIGPNVYGPLATPPALPSPADQLVAALDGSRALQELVLALRISPALVVDPLLDLIEGAVLQETAPAAAPTPWPGVRALRGDEKGGEPPATSIPTQTTLTVETPLDYDQLLLDGRRLLREGDFEAAERCFTQAVDLRPDDRIAAQNLRRVKQLRESGDARGAGWLRTGSPKP